MKVRLRVEGQWYEVEVGDLNDLPIVAVVEGQRFEVWPATEATGPADAAAQHTDQATRPAEQQKAAEPTTSDSAPRRVRAPIPGVVDSIAVSAGDWVAQGQEMLVLEAMKMKNAIRAPREGVIAAVHAVVGQHVKHNDPLVDFRD